MEENRTNDREAYRQSGWYDGETLAALNRQLAGYAADDDQLRRQAEAEYAPAYALEREALEDRLAAQTAAAENEKTALSRNYERARGLTDERYDRSAAALNNALNARGLGRSSLVATQGAYLEAQRNREQAETNRAEADDIAAINSRIARLTEETARSRQTLAASYAQQLDKRIGDLKRANQSAAVSLQLQIAALQQQGYEAWQNWLQKERAEANRAGEFERELQRQEQAEANRAEEFRQNMALKERAQALDEEEFRKKYPERETASAGAAQPAKKAAGGTASAKGNSLTALVKAAASGVKAALNSAAKRATPSKPLAESSLRSKAKSQ